MPGIFNHRSQIECFDFKRVRSSVHRAACFETSITVPKVEVLAGSHRTYTGSFQNPDRQPAPGIPSLSLDGFV